MPCHNTSASGTGNMVVNNSIYNNGTDGLILAPGANGGIVPPAASSMSYDTIGGTGTSGDKIHLYKGDGAGRL